MSFSMTSFYVGYRCIAALLWSFCVATLVVQSKRRLWRRGLSLLVLIPWALPAQSSRFRLPKATASKLVLGSFILVGTFWICRWSISALHAAGCALSSEPAWNRSTVRCLKRPGVSVQAGGKRSGASPCRWSGRGSCRHAAGVCHCNGQYVASVLVFVPNNRPVSIAIASELRDFNLGSAAAYGVILIGFIGVAMLLANKFERRGADFPPEAQRRQVSQRVVRFSFLAGMYSDPAFFLCDFAPLRETLLNSSRKLLCTRSLTNQSCWRWSLRPCSSTLRALKQHHHWRWLPRITKIASRFIRRCSISKVSGR